MRTPLALDLGSRLSLCAALALFSCSDQPSEPTPEARSSSGSASDETPKIAWEVPPSWTLTESTEQGPRRAGYAVPRVGNDTEDAELLVLFFGTGKGSARDDQWSSWLEQFDGNAKQDAVRAAFEVPAGAVETFEHVGNYKLNMGPQKKGMKRSPVQVVKKNFRMLGAFMKTKDRGNWFFRLVGPDETVKAMKEPFTDMLRSVH